MCLVYNTGSQRRQIINSFQNSQLTKKEVFHFVVYQSALEFYINAILTFQGSQAD